MATSNPHKIDEVRAILEPVGIKVIGLDSLPDPPPPEPVEDGDTFEANARIKAFYYAKQTGQTCLADDSGLEVDALNGQPGIYSARYAGLGETRQEQYTANNEKLLRELKDIPDEKRTARFVCAMCLADPDQTILAESRGTMEGRIAHVPQGSNGFGYDPLLYIPEIKSTAAELSSEEKNARSHRGAATRKIAQKL